MPKRFQLFSWRSLGWLVAIIVGLFVALQLWFLGHIVWWKYQPVESTAFMRAQETKLLQQDPTFVLKHTFVSTDRIAENLKRAVISAEDANFIDHEGVDWEAIERAWAKNQKRGKLVSGGSTITMQLAKNLFLSGERSFIRKGEELIITWMLETVLDKERILELYLNSCEWGIGVFGAQEAAKHYFQVSAAQLSAKQSAKLAAMLPNPRFYDKQRNHPMLLRRTAMINRYMGGAETP